MISTQELACILMKKQYDECMEVLAWASENVWSAQWARETEEWLVQPRDHNQVRDAAPTLYEALKSAWENREKGGK